MADTSTVIEGTAKFRDGKKWKSRWCVMRKLSPVADCLHLQMYRDSKDRYKQGQTKASLSLQHFLGVYSGFTLDKESNTLAIICQDVTVVLAFDTRERLIQWQVKIANNLGEDEQFLVQVCGAPARAKVSQGPARLHVREHRFCLTVGVPPRLVGHWRIGQLRKYGPVDNKFCFEGGSSCGRGEGLYVLVTDQSEKISHAFKMAAEGRMSVRRRPLARNMSVMTGSPRLSLQARPEARASHDDLLGGGWPSAETSGFDSDYAQSFGGSWSAAERESGGELERCSSCIGKLGLMSRSSTLTNGNADSWMSNHERRRMTSVSGYLTSEYDRRAATSLNYWTPLSESPPSAALVDRPRVCSLSGRPPHHPNSPRRSPSPAPFGSPSTSPSPYSNYDVPKSHCASAHSFQQGCSQLKKAVVNGEENYDTPRSVKNSLTPPFLTVHSNHCPVPPHCTRVVLDEESRIGTCPCQRVMCWAGSWMRLPCMIAGAFQGQNQPATIHKVKLDGEGKMPFVNCRGENYTCKSTNSYPMSATLTEELEEYSEDCSEPLMTKHYANVKIILESPNEKENAVIQTEPKPTHPYANLAFANSLEYYENFKDLRRNSGEKKTPSGTDCRSLAEENCCEKCSHPRRTLIEKLRLKNDDYLVMEPSGNPQRLRSQPSSPQRSPVHEKITQGYLPMFPISSKDMASLRRVQSNEKTQSTPALPISGKKNLSNHYEGENICTSERESLNLRNHLVTSTSMSGHDTGKILVPCDRRRASSMDSARSKTHGLGSIEEKITSPSRTLVNSPTMSDATSIGSLCDISTQRRPLPKSCSEQGLSRPDRSNKFENESGATKLGKSDTQYSFSEEVKSPSVHIKRSASIPCRKSYNRDSSGSNDSGVSTGSLPYRRRENSELFQRELADLRLCSTERPAEQFNIEKDQMRSVARILRRSKSFEPLEELEFELDRVQLPVKSSSAWATVPVCVDKSDSKGYLSPPGSVPYIDSRSTSSGTSDMSDYFETLSLSSYTSSDSYQLNHSALNTMRPRSGNEYHTIDRESLKPKITPSRKEMITDDLNI